MMHEKQLPLVLKTCDTLLHVTFLLGQIPRPEKPHRPFPTSTGILFAYTMNV